MVSFFISVTIHPIWCKILAIDFGLKLQGIAIAGCISNGINFMLMTFFFWTQEDLKEAFTWPDRRSLSGLGTYLKIGGPSIVMGCLDFWAYELMTVVSGLIGVRQQAAQVIMMNMCEMSYMVAFGL